MKLELDDFSILKVNQAFEDELSTENIHKMYQEKLVDLEKKYQKMVEEASKKAYEDGYNDAVHQYELKMSELSKKLHEECQEEIKKNLEKNSKILDQIVLELKETYEVMIGKLSSQLIEYIETILEYLYINPKNSSYVAWKIGDILEQFRKDFPVFIEISPQLQEFIHKDISKDIEIKVNKNMKGNEFIVHFDNFLINPDLQKKLELIKDELSQEIENISKLSYKR